MMREARLQKKNQEYIELGCQFLEKGIPSTREVGGEEASVDEVVQDGAEPATDRAARRTARLWGCNVRGWQVTPHCLGLPAAASIQDP